MVAALKPVSKLLHFIIWIPISIFVFPVVFALWLYNKLFEHLVTKLLKRNFRSMNSVADAMVCVGNSYSLPNTNCVNIWFVAGKWITAQEFSSHFQSCFLDVISDKYKNLYAHVTTYGSYSFYDHCKPEELDLKWHIREYSLSDFGHKDEKCTLESICAVWMTTNTFELGRPVWQIAIIHLGGLESGNMETGIVAKYSHALVDGYSLMHMIEKLTGNAAPYLVKDRAFTWMDKLEFCNKIKIKFFYSIPRDLVDTYSKIAFSSDCKNPFKNARSRPSPNNSDQKQQSPWYMSMTALDLGIVKMIRKCTNTHFICLMISIQFGAMRKLMLEKMPEAELPEFLGIFSSMPWPNHPRSLTNHFAAGFFKCPLRIVDPLERARWLEDNYRDFMEAQMDAKSVYCAIPFVRLLPAGARRFLFRHDFLLSNVPVFFGSLMLSEKQHYLLGRKVKNLYIHPRCPDLNSSCVLYCFATSHSGKIDLSISASNAVAENQEELDRLTHVYFVEELDCLAALFNSNFSSNSVTL